MKEKIRKIILFICICVFTYSAIQLGIIFYDYYQIEKASDELVETYIEQVEENNPLQRAIHFEELQKTNPDVIGWLYIPDTKIDEPILKGKNNDSYLYTDIYKKSNKAGAIFIDEINKKDFSDDNTIIYGHNMKNGSRFHDLRYFVEDDYFNKHLQIYIYLPNGTINIYDVFASCIIEATSDLYQKGIQYSQYTQSVLNKAKVKTSVSEKQKPLIMLSTCLNGTENRFVIYGQLKENVKEPS
ncbi:class B sortase [Candidatus Stoquefichus massiliensis]|uniref:class B sortase n=1 Tax=Candidatus Stoquefichus massiliensis TaxID=1470350 RepID=UPI00048519EB|nr:class B sortase [Candidatus Stoquefichus massiliensis]